MIRHRRNSERKVGVLKGLLAFPLVLTLLFSSALAAKKDKPDLSDWTPPKSKMTYGQPGEPGGSGGQAVGGRVHKVGNCAQFLALFGPKSPIGNGDQIHVGFKESCMLTSTIEIKHAIVLAGAAPSEAQLDDIYDQSRRTDFDELIQKRSALYAPGFVCDTRDKPCFLIDVPSGAVTFSGVSIRAAQELFAPLVHARGGALVMLKNLIQGRKDPLGVPQGELVLVQSSAANLRHNTILYGDVGISVYPYMAAPSSEFSSAFEVGQNVIGYQRGPGVNLSGDFSAYQRLKSEVKVYVFGNLISLTGAGVAANEVRGVIYRNILESNSYHVDIGYSEVLVDQNIMRLSDRAAISIRRSAEVYIDSNLFEDNEELAIDGVQDLFERGSPHPTNNICRNQNLKTFGISTKKREQFKIRYVFNGNHDDPEWLESKMPRKDRRQAQDHLKNLLASQVHAHILFGRPFNLNPSDGYTACYDYKYMYVVDPTAAGDIKRARRTADNFFDAE